MFASWKKLYQILALGLTLVVVQVYVFAAPATSKTVNAAKSKAAFGKLITLGRERVVVNGNAVLSGTTIFSNSQLQTQPNSSATIELGSAGKVEMAPSTRLMLSFDQTNIRVNIVSGNALLTANEGVKGSLTTPDARTQLTDGTSVASIGSELYTGDPAPQSNPKRCRIAGIRCAIFWTLVGGGTLAAILIATNVGDDDSPTR